MITRTRVEAAIEALVALLDDVDGDPDLEPSLGYNCYGGDDRELDTSDDEPSLGWTRDGFCGSTFDPDLEKDDAEHGIADAWGLAEQGLDSFGGGVE